MKNFTENELSFWNALENDYEIRGDKSFIATMFLSSLNKDSKIEKKLKKMFEGMYQKIFDNSDLLLSSIDSCFVGKYEDTFWGTDSEGEIYGIGKEIQNLPYALLDRLGDVQDTEVVQNYFQKVLNIDYFEYLNSYRDFCKSFGLEYKENLDYIYEQSEEFNKLLDEMEGK